MPDVLPLTVSDLWSRFFEQGGIGDTQQARAIVQNALDLGASLYDHERLEAMRVGLLFLADEPWLRGLLTARWPDFARRSNKVRLAGVALAVSVLDHDWTGEILGLIAAEPAAPRHEILASLFASYGVSTTIERAQHYWRDVVEQRIINDPLPYLLLREDFMCMIRAALREDPGGPLSRALSAWPEQFLARVLDAATKPAWLSFDGHSTWTEFPSPKQTWLKGMAYEPPDRPTLDRLGVATRAIAADLSPPPDLAGATAGDLIGRFEQIDDRFYPIAFEVPRLHAPSHEKQMRLSAFIEQACKAAPSEAVEEALERLLLAKGFPQRIVDGAEWREFAAMGWRATAWAYLTRYRWPAERAIAAAREAITLSREKPLLFGERAREAVIEVAKGYARDPAVSAFLLEFKSAPELYGMVKSMMIDLQFTPIPHT